MRVLTLQQSGLAVVLVVAPQLMKSPHWSCCPASCRSALAVTCSDHPGSVFPVFPHLAWLPPSLPENTSLEPVHERSAISTCLSSVLSRHSATRPRGGPTARGLTHRSKKVDFEWFSLKIVQALSSNSYLPYVGSLIWLRVLYIELGSGWALEPYTLL